ncbi:unnamed protein product [Paramecium octaurelia]|uniref:C2 domain-containing protein n=1 Tax=Paramecium octaurelia TaxID=43137 RepID=A0A8S1Y9F6_PAROT|nr:unnamed protein product [Paramecium octaurelia]
MKCEVKTVKLKILGLTDLSKIIRNSSYEIKVYFGGARQSTKILNYYVASEQIEINQDLELNSIHGKQLQFWLFDKLKNKFIGAGSYELSDNQVEGFQLLDLKIDTVITCVLMFELIVEVKDIYQPVILEDDNVILKKDDSEEKRKEQERLEQEEKLRKQQEEERRLLQKQNKVSIVTLTDRYVEDQSYY